MMGNGASITDFFVSNDRYPAQTFVKSTYSWQSGMYSTTIIAKLKLHRGLTG